MSPFLITFGVLGFLVGFLLGHFTRRALTPRQECRIPPVTAWGQSPSGDTVKVVSLNSDMVVYHLPTGDITITREENERLKRRAEEITRKTFPALAGVAHG